MFEKSRFARRSHSRRDDQAKNISSAKKRSRPAHTRTMKFLSSLVFSNIQWKKTRTAGGERGRS